MSDWKRHQKRSTSTQRLVKQKTAEVVYVRYKKLQLYASAYACLYTQRQDEALGMVLRESRAWLEENIDTFIREIQEIVVDRVRDEARAIDEKEPETPHDKWMSKVIHMAGENDVLRKLHNEVYKGLLITFFSDTPLLDKARAIMSALKVFKDNYEVMKDHIEKFGFTEIVLNGLNSNLRPPEGQNPMAYAQWAAQEARALRSDPIQETEHREV